MTDLNTMRPAYAKNKRSVLSKYATFATICLYLVIAAAVGVIRATVNDAPDTARPNAGALVQPGFPTRTLLE